MRFNRHFTCSMCSAILKPFVCSACMRHQFLRTFTNILNTDPDAKKDNEQYMLIYESLFQVLLNGINQVFS